MPTPADDTPLTWATDKPQDNFIVLTDRALYVATVAAKKRAGVDRDLEDGVAPEEVLDAPAKILVKRIIRFEHPSVALPGIAAVTVGYVQGEAERRVVLAFADAADRDTFCAELNGRVGGWTGVPRRAKHPVLTILKYTALLGFAVLCTGCLTALELTWGIQRGPAFVVHALELAGVWGIIGLGVLFCLLFVALGIFELVSPPRNVVYESDPRIKPDRWSIAMATMVQAVRLALHYGETHLGVTDIFGEDVGPPLGGVFTATQGLRTAWNSPLDERGIVGTAMGIAYAGGRPVCEIQFCDYGFNTIDLLKVAGNQKWAGAGQFDMPLVLMTPSGSGIRGSLYHSHSFESWASRLAGWKIVMPSTARDAYGLMLSAIVDPNPVMVLLPKALLRVRGDVLIPGEPEDAEQLKQMIDAPVGDRSRWQPRWPAVGEYFVPFGVATLVRDGSAATVVSYGRMLSLCVQAADQLRQERGLAFDVLDLRSIFPYDWQAISGSVAKTGRVLIVNEDTEVTNFGEHLLRRVIDAHFYDLLVRPRVLQAKHVPGIGLNQVYEQNTVPQLPQVKAAMAAVATEAA